MLNPVAVWLVDADKQDHSSIRWSVSRSPFPIDLSIFANAKEAMAAIQSYPIPPRVVIADTNLPGMSGMEFLRWIRGSRFAKTPVVIRCASTNETEIAAAYEAGANAYVVKAHDLHLIDRNISGIARFFGGLPRIGPALDAAMEPIERE